MYYTEELAGMSKPIAVLISDVHYNINTLAVADKAMRMAIAKANELDIELVVAGDLHDTKASMRAECVNAMIDTFNLCRHAPYILRGNHDQINEKSEEHSLNFLRNVANIVDEPRYYGVINATLIPYQHSADKCQEILSKIPENDLIIMHQGLNKTNAGHYFQDNSAIDLEDVAGRRIISGHYHTRQVTLLDQGGKWDYLGNPYTLGFGEANDPEKGFHVLYEDGKLEFIPTNLRKHVILQYDYGDGTFYKRLPLDVQIRADDLVWAKIYGTKEALINVTKESFSERIRMPDSFKFDLFPYETKSTSIKKNTSPNVLLDAIIDSLEHASEDQKIRLKNLWKSL